MPQGAPTLAVSSNVEPLTFDEVNAHRNMSIPGDQKVTVDGWIQTAREMCEEDLGIALLTQTREMVLDRFPVCGCGLQNCIAFHHHHGRGNLRPHQLDRIDLHRPPLQSVDWIKYRTSEGNVNVFDPSNYYIDTDNVPGRIVLEWGKTWPVAVLAHGNAVRIRYTCGWLTPAAIPSRLKSGMLLIIGALYENREASFPSERNGSSTVVMLDGATKDAVERLWRRYKAT